MPKLIICRGYPGCGKTTWANAQVALYPNWITRISRDDIRFGMLNIPQADGIGNSAQEMLVSKIHIKLVDELLCEGRDVIVDDTNLQLKVARKWADLAQRVGAEFEVVDFEVPVETCIERNWARGFAGGRLVPKPVIENMAAKHPFPFLKVKPSEIGSGLTRLYEPDRRLPEAWIFDVDGTLAHMDGRSPYEWHKVHTDKPNMPVVSLAYALNALGYKIIVMSGRDGACLDLTAGWLKDHGIKYDALVMRIKGDTRKDSIIKSELFWEHVAPFYNVLGCFDDRNQVVDGWRAMGLTCFQCAPGDF